MREKSSGSGRPCCFHRHPRCQPPPPLACACLRDGLLLRCCQTRAATPTVRPPPDRPPSSMACIFSRASASSRPRLRGCLSAASGQAT
eukprot:1378199-Rhodomonas_salina.2